MSTEQDSLLHGLLVVHMTVMIAYQNGTMFATSEQHKAKVDVVHGMPV